MGGRGLCLGAEKTRSEENTRNYADSHISGTSFVGLLFNNQISDPKKFMISCATSCGRVMVGT